MTGDLNPQPGFRFDPERYPAMAGCFLIKDGDGRALLVGGTVNIRRRLAALFEEATKPPPKTRVRGRFDDRIQRMVAMAREIEVFLLPGNRCSPSLANSLIERYHPLFNLATYMESSGSSYISLTADPFPRFTTHKKDASTSCDCFGPFPSATRDLLIKSISESFGIRTCQPMPSRACISYRLKLCPAPCEGRISKEDYHWRVAQAVRFLSAPGPGLIDALETQQEEAAVVLDFERAGRLNKNINALRPAIARLVEERGQRYEVDHDAHILYFAQSQAMRVVYQGSAPRFMEMVDAPGSPGEFLIHHYCQGAPGEIIIGGDRLEEAEMLAAELTRRNGYPVTLTMPDSGPAFDLLEIARVNHAYRAGGRTGGR